MTTRRSRSARAVVLLLVVLLGAAGCGLAANDEPHVIAADDLPPDLVSPSTSSTSTTLASPLSATVTVYYLVQRDGVTRLEPVLRDVKDATRPRERLVALLTPPSAEEQAAGIVTSIPADTILLDTELREADDELIVDLSRSLFDVQGAELRNAFAQIVWTVTEVEGVRRVRFLVGGEEFRAPDGEGVEQAGAVARIDYTALAPLSPPSSVAAPTAGSTTAAVP